MSRWSDDFQQQYKDIKCVRKATRDVIKKGGKLALEEYHSAKSLEKLKKYIKDKN